MMSLSLDHPFLLKTLFCLQHDVIVEGDVLAGWLCNRYIEKQIDVTSAMPRPPLRGAVTYSYLGKKPSVRNRSIYKSVASWIEFLSNVQHFFTDWQFNSSDITTEDKPVTHLNIIGDFVVEDSTIEDPLYQIFYDLVAVRPPSSLGDYAEIRIENSDSTNISALGDLDVSQFDYLDVLTGVRYIYHDWQISEDTVQYVVETQWATSTHQYQKFHVVRFWLRYELNDTVLSWDVPTRFSDLAENPSRVIVWNVLSHVFLIGYGGQLWTLDEVTYPSLDDTSWNEYGITTPLVSTFLLPSTVLHSYANPLRDMLGWNGRHGLDLQSFEDMTSLLISDGYPACSISSSSALDTFISRFSSNHIEFALEMKDLVRPIDLVRSLVYLRRYRRDPVGAVKALLRLLAQAKLCYSLGIAPTIADAYDVSAKAESLYSRFTNGSLYKPQTVYGDFDYDVPGELCMPFVGLHLKARSKLRLQIEPDSILASLLPYRALGILPTISTVWDLVPYSFLVDWVIPVGNVSDIFETNTLLLMANVSRSTHSLCFEWPCGSLAEEYGMGMTSGVEDTVYRLYERFILPSIPLPGPTRFSIYGGVGVPDWGTLLSLVYLKLGF